MIRYSCIILTIASALYFTRAEAAHADSSGFSLSCEPTEQSDVGRVIRQRIYDALAATKLYKKISLKSKVKVLDKAHTEKSVEELTDGLQIAIDTQTLDLSISGSAAGQACFALGELQIQLTLTLKNGSTESRSYLFPIGIPGVYATKAKVVIPSSLP